MADEMPMRQFGNTGLMVSSLGLGCSHIASLSTRASATEIARLLDIAWDGGIRFFDTADIYGQGDSERRLAHIAARPGAVICTKAGLKLKSGQAAIRLMKPVMRPVLAFAKGARKAAARARAKAEAHDLNPVNLTTRLERSLKRLRRDRVDVFLIHSPPRATLEDAELFDVLDGIKARGLAVSVGVSCQTPDDAEWILKQGRVDVLQMPLQASELAAVSGVLSQAHSAGVGLIAREVLGGVDPAMALPPLLNDARISVTLTGTTNAAHLSDNLVIARGS